MRTRSEHTIYFWASCLALLLTLASLSPAFAATPGTVSVIDYEEHSTYTVLDPIASPTSAWGCSAFMGPISLGGNGRCHTNGTGDDYVINGFLAVDPKLPAPNDNKLYFYAHLWTKGPSGPANQGAIQGGSIAVFTAPRTWSGMRGTGIVLERDDLRIMDTWEWTPAHAIYDATPGKFFVTAANPRTGDNNTYVEGHIIVGVSTNGIDNFEWRNVLKFERVNNYRMVGLFFQKDAGSCSGTDCQYSGVLSWLRHSDGFFGTTPIRYRPCFTSCSNQGEIDIRIVGQGWTTFTIPLSNAGVNLGSLQPERTIPGRTEGYTVATYGGVTQYELWRGSGAQYTGTSWAPCATSNATYVSNLQDWPAGQGAKLQYRRYDPVTGTSVDNLWIDFTSPYRNITPARYARFTSWIVGRIDYGGENLLYIANRDRHVCNVLNTWDFSTGKNVEWIKLGESIGTNQ